MNKIVRLVIALVCGFIAAVVLRSVIPISILFYPELVLVAWGAWISVPKVIPALKLQGVATVKSEKQIEVTQDGDWTTINVPPAPLPRVRFIAISVFVGLCCALVSGLIASADTTPYSYSGNSGSPALTAFIVGILGAVGTFYLAKTVNNKARHVQSAPFAVRADAIRLPTGQVVAAGDMYRIIITNAMDNAYVMNPFYTGNTMSTTVLAAQSALTASNARAIGKVAFILNLEHSGTRSPLAGGLTEPQAHAAFLEISGRVDTFRAP